MIEYLDEVLAELRKSRGIDFSGYRRSMLERRLAARMARLRCDDPAKYLSRLKGDPDECDRLVNTIAINVSAFFRNPVVWENLAQSVLPETIERKRNAGDHELRVWSAGCASGEEAYSAAILVHRALRGDPGPWRLRIFGTDIDRSALQAAVHGWYRRESFEDTKLGILDEYFSVSEASYHPRTFLRKMVSFSYDNLTSPETFAPKESVFGTFDLVLCRNVLIYFNLALQETVLGKLIRTLDAGGYLVLGDSESLTRSAQSRLTEVDGRNRIFSKRQL